MAERYCFCVNVSVNASKTKPKSLIFARILRCYKSIFLCCSSGIKVH